MLPQSRTLEEQTADKQRSARNGLALERGNGSALTGVQHVQGEKEPAPQNAERGVTRTFVLGKDGTPLMPCSNARARILIRKDRAKINRLFPFTIQLTDRERGDLQPVAIKFDPGAKTTGVGIVRLHPEPTKQSVLHLAEITHRGQAIRKHMTQRAMFRRRRRSANCRYRAPRFLNRTRTEGWLPPSLQSRVDNIASWFNRYRKLAPITSVHTEHVPRFDTQALENSEIEALEYQRGTLFGRELWEYLLEKWGRKCAYCDAGNVPLEAEHIEPKTRGGSNRVSNLTLSCHPCNQNKGSRPVSEFLANDPARLDHVLSHTKRSLSNAAAINITRKAIVKVLQASRLPVSCSSGGRTKFNRSQLGVPKTHALDAACVGELSHLERWNVPVFSIKATGRASYQRTRLDSFGFPRGYLMRQKSVKGFQTGDIVRAGIPTGKFKGIHQGRVAVRVGGTFVIQALLGKIETSWKYCTRLVRNDGYDYQTKQERDSSLS
jgi:5-methylcytosine-specific restriction endonuclease McrA